MKKNTESVAFINFVMADVCKILEIKDKPTLDVYYGNDKLIVNGIHVNGIYANEKNLLKLDANDTRNDNDIVRTIAHELRHKWQYMNGKKHYEDKKDVYVKFLNKYLHIIWKRIYRNDPTEIDAEAFAWKYLRDRFGIELVSLSELSRKDRKMLVKPYERIKELDKEYQIKSINEEKEIVTEEDNI